MIKNIITAIKQQEIPLYAALSLIGCSLFSGCYAYYRVDLFWGVVVGVFNFIVPLLALMCPREQA